MANALYANGKDGILDGTIAVLTDDIRVALIDATYVPNVLADKFISDTTGIVARSGALTGKTDVDGVFDANDVIVASVTGATVTQFVLFKHTGSDATARLICLYDTGITGLPFAPSGSSVPITWDNGVDKIFAL